MSETYFLIVYIFSFNSMFPGRARGEAGAGGGAAQGPLLDHYTSEPEINL